MNIGYPSVGIAILGPILLFVMLGSFLIIGFFGGWKRALYWGGGNLIFYFIGMLIWQFASPAISRWLNGLLAKFTAGLGIQANLTAFLQSILVPFFFIIFLLLSNLILMLNYFIWFKRVAKIKRVVKTKNSDGSVSKKKVSDFDERSKGYKAMSHVVGSLGLSALLLPTMLTFTQSTMYLTTSVNNRENNKFVTSFYNGLKDVSSKLNWMSYYKDHNTPTDFDAIWSSLYLLAHKMEFNDVWDEEEPGIKELTVMQAIATTLDSGLGGIFGATTDREFPIDYRPESQEEVEQYVRDKVGSICTMVDNLADAWNSLMLAENGGAEKNIIALFISENASAIVKQLIGIKTNNIHVSPQQILNYGEDNYFDWMMQLFQSGQVNFTFHFEAIIEEQTIHYDIPINYTYSFHEFHRVNVNQVCYDNIREAIVGSYDLSDLDDDGKQLFDDRMDELLNILFE